MSVHGLRSCVPPFQHACHRCRRRTVFLSVLFVTDSCGSIVAALQGINLVALAGDGVVELENILPIVLFLALSISFSILGLLWSVFEQRLRSMLASASKSIMRSSMRRTSGRTSARTSAPRSVRFLLHILPHQRPHERPRSVRCSLLVRLCRQTG